MAKNKLKKWAEMVDMPHVFQASGKEWMTNDYPFKGNWLKNFFKNNNPVVIEIGCGRGEYTVALAKLFPNKNFIGIDVKGNRMWYGAKESIELNQKNVAFLRTRAEFLKSFFGKNEVSEIWLTFSDPQPKKENKRLTSEMFLNLYTEFVSKKGVVNLKTDSDLLYNFTLRKAKELNKKINFNCDNIYNDSLPTNFDFIKNVQTFYEKIWLSKGITIKFVQFNL